jgi:hypothetical protein
MKNIYLIPTDKPSRLGLHQDNKLNLHDDVITLNPPHFRSQNIYITNDEEIKEDYVIAYGVVIKVMMFDDKILYFVNGTKAKREDCKKIIMTTDQDLIADGIEQISEDTLLKIVEHINSGKNIEAKQRAKNYMSLKGALEPKDVVLGYKTSLDAQMLDRIEPKQETNLEESAESFAHNYFEMHETNNYKALKQGFKEGAKYEAERMYSEEDMEEAFTNGLNRSFDSDFDRWIEQFKKK